MLEWFEAVGYDADLAGNAREFGIKPTTIGQWASRLNAVVTSELRVTN